MKKLLLIFISGAIFLMLLVACSFYEDSPISSKMTTEIIIESAEIDTKDFHNLYLGIASGNIQDWQKAYILFLREFVILDDYEICLYALRDINLDGVPELILHQSDVSYALLEIYSFKDGVFKIGEYTDAKVGSGLCVSDNPLYPGLFDLRWGGGVEHYGYITVDEDLLVYEYLWFNNLAPEEVAKENGQPGKNIVSDNKELIEISENLFYGNNLLEMFILEEDISTHSVDIDIELFMIEEDSELINNLDFKRYQNYIWITDERGERRVSAPSFRIDKVDGNVVSGSINPEDSVAQYKSYDEEEKDYKLVPDEPEISNDKIKLGERNEEGIYTYDSNQNIISIEQAVDLVAEIVEAELLVQKEDTYQYWINPRISKAGDIQYLSLEEWEQYKEQGIGELGEQLIINKIECRDSQQEAKNNGYYEVIIYEDIIDDIETGEGHQAITRYYAVDWKEQIIVEDYLWNDWYCELIQNREIEIT